MKKPVVYVYIVHQDSECIVDGEILKDHKDHRLLGVYFDRHLAETHRSKLIARDIYHLRPHIAVTRHVIRGTQVILGNVIFL